MPPEAEQQFALLRGRLLEASGPGARRAHRLCPRRQRPDLPSRADADQRHLAVRHKLGDIDRKAAIEELEAQSYAWRGDDIEARTLALLAKLYADQGQFRDAFTTMRLAMRVHPRSESVRGMQDDVARHFERLFLEGSADQMKAVDALALYYDFRDMTPQGPARGDEIIRRLADRLAGMDLLDQAASLLQHQIDRRLTGAALAGRRAPCPRPPDEPQAGRGAAGARTTRLSELPERAAQPALPARGPRPCRHEPAGAGHGDDRRHPHARGGDAARDILWAPSAIANRPSRASAGSPRAAPGPSATRNAAHILRAAIGYALVDDTLGLDRLRGRYRAAMRGTPDERAFDVVTSPIEARGWNIARSPSRSPTATRSTPSSRTIASATRPRPGRLAAHRLDAAAAVGAGGAPRRAEASL